MDKRLLQREIWGREGSWEACVEQVTAGFSNHKEWQRGWVRRGELKRTELQAVFQGTNSAAKQAAMDVNNGLFSRGFVPCCPANHCLEVLNTPHTRTHCKTDRRAASDSPNNSLRSPPSHSPRAW